MHYILSMNPGCLFSHNLHRCLCFHETTEEENKLIISFPERDLIHGTWRVINWQDEVTVRHGLGCFTCLGYGQIHNLFFCQSNKSQTCPCLFGECDMDVPSITRWGASIHFQDGCHCDNRYQFGQHCFEENDEYYMLSVALAFICV